MSYVTGELIKKIREEKRLTQKDLADKLCISDKTISKWETGKGLPDIGILEDLATALGISISDILTGEYRVNDNVSANMNRLHFYVCPICGNVITAIGATGVSCCGISLPEIEAEEAPDEAHEIIMENIDGDYYVSIKHDMTKKHYISWIAYTTSDTVEIKKLYPQQEAMASFRKKGHGYIYAYCNRHGLMRSKV